MLGLTVKPGQGVYIGPDIYIRLDLIRSNHGEAKIKVYVDAPKTVPILHERLRAVLGDDVFIERLHTPECPKKPQ